MFPNWVEDPSLTKKLYKNVKNTTALRKFIFSEKLPFTLINPKLIVDVFQLSVGITKALSNQNEGRMTTRTLPTEIIYSLSPSKSISDSLKTFSAQDGDTELLVVGDSQRYAELGNTIQGEEVPLMDLLVTITDTELVKKVYGISQEELKTSSLLESVVSRMASKEYATATATLSGSGSGNR